MHTFLIAIEILLAVVLIVAVLLQPSKTQGLNGLISGGASDRFFSKNKSRTYESMLSKLTIVASVLFAIVTIALNLKL